MTITLGVRAPDNTESASDGFGSDHGRARRPLRIAMIAPPWYELPPRGYGGIEMVCAALVDALVARGHHVTLFGAGSRTGTRARFVSTASTLWSARLGEPMPEMLHAARVGRLLAAGGFDVVHDHTMLGLLAAAGRPAPTVVTVHGTVTGEGGDYLKALGSLIRPVAISGAQRRSRPDLRWVATIHNGIDTSQLRPGVACPDGPVLWLARFSPDKGADLAIAACRAAGLPLLLAGKASEPSERRYLDEQIRPMLCDDVRLICDPGRRRTQALLSEARCLIMPIRWSEPFGMVMIEAMAAGKPVVALRNGSVPEVVRDGVTGWTCRRPDDLPAALHRSTDIDPEACVDHVRRTFSADLMARRYEWVYRAAVLSCPPQGGSTVARSAGPYRGDRARPLEP